MEAMVVFGFFLVIVLVVIGFGAFALVLDFRKKASERELTHAERLKALETGMPLPDAEVAWAAADGTRWRMAGLIGILVPVLTVIAAFGATVGLVIEGKGSTSPDLAFFSGGVPWYGKVMFVIWPVWGVVSLVTVALCVAALFRRRSPPAPVGKPAPVSLRRTEPEPVTAAFAERPVSP